MLHKTVETSPADWFCVTRVDVPKNITRKEMNNLRAGLYSKAQYRKIRYNPLMEYTVRLTEDKDGAKYLALFVRLQGNRILTSEEINRDKLIEILAEIARTKEFFMEKTKT